MKKLVKLLIFLSFICTLLFGTYTFTYCKEALFLWFEKLVPSLFVTMVLIRIMYQLRILHRIPIPFLSSLLNIEKSCIPLLICAVLLGFPGGSQFIDEAYQRGEVNEEGARRLLYTCAFATAGFVIMTCGVVFFQSTVIGFYLYALQLISGFILLLCTRSTPVIGKVHHSSIPPLMQAMSTSIVESGKTLYMIGGYLMLFMSVTGVLFYAAPDSLQVFLRSILEFSSGSVLIHQSSLTFSMQLLALSALLGFGGFCVHMQIFSMVSHISMRYVTFFFYRILQSLLATLLCLISFRFLF